MNLLDALTELVAFARENDGCERLRIAQACKRAEARIAVLSRKAENRAAGRKCRRCGLGAFGLCCWRCWQAMPAHYREMFEGAKTTGAKRAAMEVIFEWIQRNPVEAQP